MYDGCMEQGIEYDVQAIYSKLYKEYMKVTKYVLNVKQQVNKGTM